MPTSDSRPGRREWAGALGPTRFPLVVFALAGWLLTGSPGQLRVQGAEDVPYKIEFEKEGEVGFSSRDREGNPGLFITVRFKIRRTLDGQLATDIAKDEIVVEEDGRRVAYLDIHQPASLEPLTVILAIDASGSMAEHGKMEEAKRAALLFLDKLTPKADCGLILFDHTLLVKEAPAGDPKRLATHRDALRAKIAAAQSRGGTAYLDATAEAVRMLRGISGRKAVLLLTDGVDLNSQHTLDGVIEQARAAEVAVYTLGVGEPGRNEPVTSVLVLDRSGSMGMKADNESRITKIAALRDAASRFLDLMRPKAATTLLPFSSTVDIPQPFSADKAELKRRVQALRPEGETALFDAAYTAVETLAAARRPGKQAVVVLTDGIDNRSRRRATDVVTQARANQIPVHMLGLGREGELNAAVMQKIARETGGSYHHARNEQALFTIFENLSIQLHDDGIDEDSLRKLAQETRGKYYPARDVRQLALIYEELAQDLQSAYTVTFPSRRPAHDGTARGIDIQVMRQGRRVSDVASADYNLHGVVVPEMDHRIYLFFLTLIAGLLAIPPGLRRLYRYYGGT